LQQKSKNKKEVRKMKKVNPSKLMKERARKIVEVVSPTDTDPAYIENASQVLAEVLELPTVNTVDGAKYGAKLQATVLTILCGDMPTNGNDTLYDCVIKTKRVLSPEVRAQRYEKAVEQLKIKYNMGV
jgi:hypothetical protein